MICRRAPGRPSAVCRTLQSRSLAGFSSGYATLPRTAPPLNDASTAHGGEAASTLTLLPKQRGREQTGCCQLLLLGSFLRGLETNLDSRSPVTGPCRNHASPQSRLPCAELSAPADCTATHRQVKATPAGCSIGRGRRLPDRLSPGIDEGPPGGGPSVWAAARAAGRACQPLYLDGPTCGYHWPAFSLDIGPYEPLIGWPSAVV